MQKGEEKCCRETRAHLRKTNCRLQLAVIEGGDKVEFGGSREEGNIRQERMIA